MLKLSDYLKDLNPVEVRNWRDCEIAGVSNNSVKTGKNFISTECTFVSCGRSTI